MILGHTKSFKLQSQSQLCDMTVSHGYWEKGKSKVKSAEIQFLLSIKGCTRDHIRNKDIHEELNMKPLLPAIHEYGQSWCTHVEQLEDFKILRNKWFIVQK